MNRVSEIRNEHRSSSSVKRLRSTTTGQDTFTSSRVEHDYFLIPFQWDQSKTFVDKTTSELLGGFYNKQPTNVKFSTEEERLFRKLLRGDLVWISKTVNSNPAFHGTSVVLNANQLNDYFVKRSFEMIKAVGKEINDFTGSARLKGTMEGKMETLEKKIQEYKPAEVPKNQYEAMIKAIELKNKTGGDPKERAAITASKGLFDSYQVFNEFLIAERKKLMAFNLMLCKQFQMLGVLTDNIVDDAKNNRRQYANQHMNICMMTENIHLINLWPEVRKNDSLWVAMRRVTWQDKSFDFVRKNMYPEITARLSSLITNADVKYLLKFDTNNDGGLGNINFLYEFFQVEFWRGIGQHVFNVQNGITLSDEDIKDSNMQCIGVCTANNQTLDGSPITDFSSIQANIQIL